MSVRFTLRRFLAQRLYAGEWKLAYKVLRLLKDGDHQLELLAIRFHAVCQSTVEAFYREMDLESPECYTAKADEATTDEELIR